MSILWYPTPKQSPLLGVTGLGGGIASRLGGRAPNPYRGLVGNGSLRSGFTNLQMAFPFTDAKGGEDLSGNGRSLSNHGPNNAVEYSISGTDKNGDPPPYTTAYGKTQSSMDYSWYNANTDYDFRGSQNLTVECWFQINSPDTFIQILNMYGSQSEGQVLNVSTGNGVRSFAWSGSVDYDVKGGSASIVVGRWHHAAYTRNSSTSPDTHTVFLDGVQVAQTTSDTYGGSYTENQFANGQYGGGGGVAGSPAPNSFIMDFRTFNTVKYTSDFDIADYLPTLDA